MRKAIFTIMFALAGMTAFAQGSKDYLPDGVITTEWRFNPFDYESKPTNMAQLNARMFLNNKSALRLGVGVGFKNDKDEEGKSLNTQAVNASNYDIANGTTTTTNKEFSLKVGLGYEYHFASIGRMDFYSGIEAGYLGRFYSATKESSTTTDNYATSGSTSTHTTTTEFDNAEYKKSNADRTKFNENGIYGTVFTGVDFYIYRKLYVGVELGLTFNTGKKSNGTYETAKGKVSTVGGTQIENWTERYSSETGTTTYVDKLNSNNNKTTCDWAYENKGTFTKVYIEPAIRLGWMF